MFFNIAQTDSSQMREQEVEAVHIDRFFSWKYKQQLSMIERVYPMALEAKRIIDSLDYERSQIDKKRKQKKYVKQVHEDLEDQFGYAVKDLYVSEGKLLLKLIHRETGMSLYDILSEYRSNTRAQIVHSALKLFGHDTKSTFDAKGDDWITEIVIQDIETGRIQFDTDVKLVSKNEYKEGMKEYRQDHREYRKEKRKKKKKEKSST